MTFEILTPTDAKLRSVTPRTEKHGDDDVFAISLGLSITGPNTMLDALSPTLRHALYMAVPRQDPPPAAVVPAPRADEPATLKLGDICGRLGFTVAADFLADSLHVKPAAMPVKGRGLYTEAQFQTICRQLIAHVGAMAELYGAEVAA